MLNIIGSEDDPRLGAHSGGVLVPLTLAVFEAIRKIGVFVLLGESKYDEVFGFVAFTCVEEVLSSDNSGVC